MKYFAHHFPAAIVAVIVFTFMVRSVPARADTISTSSIGGPGAVSNNGPTSSSASNNRGESISSFYTTIDGIANMGASYMINGDGDQVSWPYAQTSTVNDDSWYITCTPQSTCESVVSNPIPVSLAVTFNGTLNAPPDIEGENGAWLSAEYNLGSLLFSLGINQTASGLVGDASWCQEIGPDWPCTDIPINFVANGDGTYSFSVSSTYSTTVCGDDGYCPVTYSDCPHDAECAADNVSFTDEQSIGAQAYDNNYDYFLDASDPFTVDLTSDDPDYQFVSADGRVSGMLSPAPTPEPGGLGLLGTALGLLGIVRYRKGLRASLVPSANLFRR